MERPKLSRDIDSKTFREYYYLKEELIDFCRENGLPVSGGKIELTERISFYLETGKVLPATTKTVKRKSTITTELTRESIIEDDFVCSEKHKKLHEAQSRAILSRLAFEQGNVFSRHSCPSFSQHLRRRFSALR